MSAAQYPNQRSRDFTGSAVRLVKRLAPQRPTAVAVIVLGIAGTVIGVLVPRILGHATDLLFSGVLGRRLPAGITKAQAIAAARAHGNNTFADLLSGTNVVPGRGVDFAAVAQTLALALVMYIVAALLVWHRPGCSTLPCGERCRRCAPMSRTSCTGCRWPTSIRGNGARCSAGSPTTSTTSRHRWR